MDAAFESNAIFLDAWDALNHRSASFESRRGGLVDVSWGGVPVPFFNLAVTVRIPASAAEFEATARETCAWAGERQLPWLFAVCHETLGDLLPAAGQVLENCGLAQMMTLTGMAADEIAPAPELQPAIACRTEEDPAVPDLAMRLNEAAYQMPLGEPGSLAMEQPGWWAPPQRFLSVVEAGGRPASCAAVLGVNGLRYVALVATHPEMQRRGLADLAMRHALQRSLGHGLSRRTYLHATEAGRPVYTRMGYSPTALYSVYAPHP